MILTLNFATAVLYLFAALGYFLHLIFAARRMSQVSLLLMTAAVAVQSGLLALHVIQTPYPFFVNEGDVYYFTSWVVATGFLVVRRKYRVFGMGALFSGLSLFLFILAEIRRKHIVFAGAENPWMLIHILFMSLAFAVFAVSFVVGLVYLIQQFQLKSRQTGRSFLNLPSLETIDLIHYRALTVGFALLSVGIIAGALLSKTSQGRFFSGDSRQITAVCAWALYAFFLNVRLSSAWRGRRGILLSILGFVGVVLAFLTLDHRGM